MGVRLIDVADGDSVVAIARNAEASADEDSDAEPGGTGSDVESDAPAVVPDQGGSGGGAPEED
jgi:DNA gyrase subunit A